MVILVVENLRLSELVLVANKNKNFFNYFLDFLKSEGMSTLQQFIRSDEEVGYKIILKFLNHNFPDSVVLYDGVFSPYDQTKAKWFLLGWILRDAPTQRLQPIVNSMPGSNVLERKAHLLNKVRIQCSNIFPEPSSWKWAAIREVFVDRLEGSRRAKKGALLEVIVRDLITDLIEEYSLPLTVNRSEIRLENETYDVSVVGSSKTLLIPVKTRETMGGGHAHIFTRDIRVSISRAAKAGYEVFPIIIAESWSGDINDLETKSPILIQINPNQIDKLRPILRKELKDRLSIFRGL